MIKHAKLIKIGNSQGIRLPKSIISKYGFGNTIILEETEAGVLLHAPQPGKLSWEDTYKEMARTEQGEWDDWGEIDIEMDTHL